jgi:hypothetical protein
MAPCAITLEKAFKTVPTVTREKPRAQLNDPLVFVLDVRIASAWKKGKGKANGQFIRIRKTPRKKDKMKRVVTLKGPSIDSQDEYVLTECLKIMFPNCEVEIRSAPPENSRDEEARIDLVGVRLINNKG